ncbi:MAG: T9SS type A sorting domain-containing protein [Ignavibacteria bacterium]|nr:T9SS type A sorting domain-containing protein [Ignavibacteria bacterium]
MILIKYSANGNIDWLSIYSDTLTPFPNNSNGGGSLIFDKTGNIFNGGTKLWKYNENGSLIWTVNPGIYRGYGRIYFDNDYNILTSSELANSSFHIRKYSYEGDTMWVRIFKPAGTIDARWKDAVLDRNGYIITTGYMNKTGIGDRYDCMTVKYSNSGELLWYNRFSEGVDNFSYSIACDNLNNIYIAGEKDLNILTIKYSSEGDTLWKRIYDGGNGDIGYDIEADTLGNVYTLGVSVGFGIVLLKYNFEGNLVWIKSHSPADLTTLPILKLDKYCNLYLSYNYTTNQGGEKIVIVKYNTEGILQWSVEYNYMNNNTSLSQIRDLFIDKNLNVYITGNGTGGGVGYNLFTVKWSQVITNIPEINNSVIHNYKLFQNYPNPFNPKTIINYYIPASGFVSLKIYDALGNEVTAIVNEKQSAGSYDAAFDGTGLSSGIYFYSLYSDGILKDTKRMLLLK